MYDDLSAATDDAPAARVTPSRTKALKLLTPCISGCDGLVMLAVLLEKFCWVVELYGE